MWTELLIILSDRNYKSSMNTETNSVFTIFLTLWLNRKIASQVGHLYDQRSLGKWTEYPCRNFITWVWQRTSKLYWNPKIVAINNSNENFVNNRNFYHPISSSISLYIYRNKLLIFELALSLLEYMCGINLSSLHFVKGAVFMTARHRLFWIQSVTEIFLK